MVLWLAAFTLFVIVLGAVLIGGAFVIFSAVAIVITTLHKAIRRIFR